MGSGFSSIKCGKNIAFEAKRGDYEIDHNGWEFTKEAEEETYDKSYDDFVFFGAGYYWNPNA